MIKLDRTPCPDKLMNEQQELTKIFKAEGKNVWNKDYIKNSLLEMSHSKCSYCETKLDKPSIYMEVEHFYSKDHYKDKVVEWQNLFPSCKRCNVNKGSHDVGVDPIINPCIQNPKDHLDLKNYRLRGKTQLGISTIRILYLNESDKLVKTRYEVGNKVIDKLEEFYEDIQEKTNTSRKLRNHLNRIKALLKEGQKTEEYAVTISTVILQDDSYEKIKEFLKQNNFCDNELDLLENGLKEITL